jgi:NhaP-type Na+/H+ or K+/H+ antiporter
LAAPILLVLAGLAASYLPGVPEFRLNPHVILFAVLPPLVYTTALESSYLNLWDNLRTLALLSVGLVLFTAAAVAGAAWAAVPGLPLAAAFALGSILAPTDAVTTASIGRRLHLLRRLLTIITGESMLNDGTALTVYAVAVSAASAGVPTPSPLADVRSLVTISAGGVVVGLVLGFLVHRIRMRLRDSLAASDPAHARPRSSSSCDGWPGPARRRPGSGCATAPGPARPNRSPPRSGGCAWR